MTTKITLFFILLASIAICSSSPILACRCLKTRKSVKWSYVAKVIKYEPRAYCRKIEVIAIMKNKHQYCVDPNEPIPPNIPQEKPWHMKAHASRLESTGSQPPQQHSRTSTG